MKRLTSLALLIVALLVLDQVFYQGRYAEVVMAGMSNQAQAINRSAESIVARFTH